MSIEPGWALDRSRRLGPDVGFDARGEFNDRLAYTLICKLSMGENELSSSALMARSNLQET